MNEVLEALSNEDELKVYIRPSTILMLINNGLNNVFTILSLNRL